MGNLDEQRQRKLRPGNHAEKRLWIFERAQSGRLGERLEQLLWTKEHWSYDDTVNGGTSKFQFYAGERGKTPWKQGHTEEKNLLDAIRKNVIMEVQEHIRENAELETQQKLEEANKDRNNYLMNEMKIDLEPKNPETEYKHEQYFEEELQNSGIFLGDEIKDTVKPLSCLSCSFTVINNTEEDWIT